MFKLRSIALCLITLTVVAVACAVQKPLSTHNLNQGIEGYIYELKGNHMPMKGKASNSDNHGVKREIWIFRAATIQQTSGNTPLYDQVLTPLIKKTTSNSNGYYKVNLPAGKYSVFVKEQGKLFAAETDGNILNPATVVQGIFTTRNITITVNAAF